MSHLQEDSTLSVNAAVLVSDNARTRTRVIDTVYSQKPARRSRWGPKKEKSQLSPKVPSRRVNSEHTQRIDEPLPALSPRLQRLGPTKTMDHLLLAE
jgi:hypothetical protein